MTPEPDPDTTETELLPPDPSDPLATARYLGASMIRMAAQLKASTTASEDRDAKLDRYARRSRLYICIDVFLTLALAGMGFWVSSTSERASSASTSAAAANARAAAVTAVEQAQHAEAVSGCVSGNQYRAGVVVSLDRLVMLLEGPHPTAVIRKAAVGYERYVLSKNEPRDCAASYSLPKPKETASAK
jgi:hypothetical protein